MESCTHVLPTTHSSHLLMLSHDKHKENKPKVKHVCQGQQPNSLFISLISFFTVLISIFPLFYTH